MKVSDLRGILNYVPSYREKVFVIALDGAVLAGDNISNLILDIAVLWSLRIRTVLVHGAGQQIKDLSAQTATPISNYDGSGITDPATLSVALTAANRLTHEIMEGLTSVDMRCIYPNAIIAHPVGIIDGIDQQHTGKVERVDEDLLRRVLAEDIVPVIPPLGFDGAGRTFRVNSDAVALAVARALRAVKLIFVTANDKLTRGGEVIQHMSVDEAAAYQKSCPDEIPPELRSKVAHGIGACRDGIDRVHIVNGKVDEALLSEVFLNEGIGTMIYANQYQSIRRAMKKDVQSIQNLIKRAVQSQEILPRTRAMILQQLNDYYVFEVDRNVLGCVALHPDAEGRRAEVACLYVSASHENQGIGRRLLAYVEKVAREAGIEELFALSTQTFAFFEQKGGFSAVSPDILPAKRREQWEKSGRNSRVLAKDLRSQPATMPV
ncbi:MAG: amino-acid N-acetyltransferase [Verrucomicrobiae bacterium]|nr:amino-acid N-acetyltransferase [Verrucomicrobiae bacterium]